MGQLDTIKQVPSKPDRGCENLATENTPLLSWRWILGSQVNSSAPVGRVNNTRPKPTFPKVPLGNLQASDLWHWHFVKLVYQGEKQGSQHMSTCLTPCCLIISTITARKGLTRAEGRPLKQSVKAGKLSSSRQFQEYFTDYLCVQRFWTYKLSFLVQFHSCKIILTQKSL